MMSYLRLKYNSLRNVLKCVPVVFILSIVFTINCCAQAISSKDLIEDAKSLDGKKIIYSGELVTAVLDRGMNSWINLNDGYNAIGVWCKKDSLDFVKFIGDYKNNGDHIEVLGVFNRACPIHGGELDIHADSVSLLKRGYFVKEKLNMQKLNLAIELFLVIMLAVVIFRKRMS